MATGWDKIEDALKALLEAETGPGDTLEGWTVQVGDSEGVAVEPDTITIWTSASSMDQFEEQAQTIHTTTIEIEFAKDGDRAGVLSRAIKDAAAAAHALIAADRSLGGRLQDMQEQDIAPTPGDGRDTASASLQYKVQFFTPRDDWTTILGAAGATF